MCGIFGIENHPEASGFTYLGLYALQHRGQESSGLVSWSGETMNVERGMGLVADVFKSPVLERLVGASAIGHTRYSTAGASAFLNAQPIVVNTAMGPLAVVHNGNLTNARAVRSRLEARGAIFQTSSDTEVILHLMARKPREDIVESLMEALGEVTGAYSLLLLTSQGVIAARDPFGIRPLFIGRFGDTVCFASETCAFDLVGAEIESEVAPGEVVRVRNGEIDRFELKQRGEPTRCAFEHVYFARPDSQVYEDSVARVRTAMGAVLAREQSADADIVVPVPDSGLCPALGFARESGLPFELGMTRNHYVGRTFIQPQQSIRDFGVRVKLNPDRHLIAGRRVVLVDDSIVRGTTSRKIVRMVREVGAAEVHLRISSPPTRWPCHYGVDTPRRQELIAAQNEVEGIRQYIEADSLGYLSVDGMLSCLSGSPETYCTACWTGKYRVPIEPGDDRQHVLFPIHPEQRS